MPQIPSNRPKSPFVVNSTSSVGVTSLNGTNFSIYGVGGYMEVYNVSDLYYTIPSGTIGQVYNAANTIPINFFVGTGYSNNTLFLNSDNISSGRRKLGMLVYVYETDQIYQFKINNYDSLWSAATASTGTVVSTQYGTIVQGNSAENNSFINAWTGNTVEGISGETSSTAAWKKLVTGSGGGGSGITGGTYYPNTLTLDLESTGGTISIGNVTGLYISAGTYTSGTSTLDLFNSTGGTISITGITAGSGGSGGTSNFQYFISGSSPTGTINDGDRWFYTESGEEFVWITDQNSSQWVQPVSISYGVSEEFVHITGDTMTGTLYVPTISATTYLNIPTATFTGGTVSGATIFTGGLTANTLTVTGNTTLANTSGTSFYTNYIDFNLTATTTSAVSRLRYDSGEGGLVTTMIGGNVDLKLGQENVVYCYNGDTVNLSKGQVVAIIGNQGNRPKIQRAIASAETTSSTALGIVSETINTGNEGFVTTFGTVRGFQITGITPGSYVYLSPTTLGGFTGTQPQAPDHIVALGYVVRTGNTQGEIFVNISNGWEINELHNVRITNPTNNDILQLSAGTSDIWVNVSSPTLNGLTVTGNTSAQGLTATTISATTYQNLPTDIRVTGATYSNNTFTYRNNTGGTFNVLFNTLTGLTVNGNITTTGVTTLGNGTFTKAGFATGDVLLDNSGTDTPGVLFYYANNSNYGIDSWNGSFDVLSGQLLRFTNNLNESGGAVKAAIDTSGNLAVGGFVKVNAWRAGQVVNDIMLSNTEVTVSTTTIATSTSDTDFVTYSYTPLSSSSYLVIHYHLADYSFASGTGNDSYFSRIKIDGNEITYSKQSTVNGNRSGVLFPLTGRYTNSNTTAKSVVVACRRDSADDSITIVNAATSMWLRITEIAR
jgi:hypothetical protein